MARSFLSVLLAVFQTLSAGAGAAGPSKAITEAPIPSVDLARLMEAQKHGGLSLPFPGPEYRFSLVFDKTLTPHVLVQGPESRESVVLSLFDRKKFIAVGRTPVFFILIGSAPGDASDLPGLSNHLYLYDSNKAPVASVKVENIFEATYNAGFKVSYEAARSVLYAPSVKRKNGTISIPESVQMLRRGDKDTYWPNVFPLNRLKDHVNWFMTVDGRRIGVWLDPRKIVRFYWMDSSVEQHLPPRVPPSEAVDAALKSN